MAGVAAFLAFLRDNVSGPHWQSTSFADRAHDRMQSDNWLDTEDARVPEETLFRLGSEGLCFLYADIHLPLSTVFQ